MTPGSPRLQSAPHPRVELVQDLLGVERVQDLLGFRGRQRPDVVCSSYGDTCTIAHAYRWVAGNCTNRTVSRIVGGTLPGLLLEDVGRSPHEVFLSNGSCPRSLKCIRKVRMCKLRW